VRRCLLLFCGFAATSPAAALRYWVAPCSSETTGCRSGDPELAQWAMEAWQTASNGHLALEKTADREKAHIRLYWTTGSAGLFGETRPIMVDGVRGAEVYVLPTVVPPGETDAILRDAIVYLTCVHETGHALGLEHTADFADIMYSFQYGGDIRQYFDRYRRLLTSRSDIRKHSGLSANDRSQLSELYRQSQHEKLRLPAEEYEACCYRSHWPAFLEVSYSVSPPNPTPTASGSGASAASSGANGRTGSDC
jgi:hypothetical protein